MIMSEYIPPDALRSMLLGMFEFSPIPMAITTAGTDTSRYVKVNSAYLKLIGRSWEEIAGRAIVDHGAAIDDDSRQRRLRLLEEVGHYMLEEVSLRHTQNGIIPTLISAQRSVIDGCAYDIEIIFDISSRVMMQKELERHLTTAAMTDALTRLPNRAHFDNYFQEAVANARAADRTVALAFLDLNGFKSVNDRFGHAIGDQVLSKIAERLRARCRPTDFVARLGGDEFAIVYHVASADAGRLAARLRSSLKEAFAPIGMEGVEFEIGAAVGLAFLSSAADTALSLLKLADREMYRAKASGERVAIRVAHPNGSVALAG
ncbi:GGDEF domain-containing protein [Bosea sp. 117]|uniref:GGDEF domain-containing protein n=1 Tax=Bosea sp. 117 TaxID=1125973 RepID=UPI00068A76E5|nr:GGDEF domain-containing protein [Bosea sp. 117]